MDFFSVSLESAFLISGAKEKKCCYSKTDIAQSQVK